MTPDIGSQSAQITELQLWQPTNYQQLPAYLRQDSFGKLLLLSLFFSTNILNY